MMLSLNELRSIARTHAENRMSVSGDLTPSMTYFLQDVEDRIHVIECRIADQNQKNALSLAIKAMAISHNATSYAGYFLASMTEGVSKEEVKEFSSVSQHPDTFDVLLIHGQNNQNDSATDVYKLEKKDCITSLVKHSNNETGNELSGPLFNIIPKITPTHEDRLIAGQFFNSIKRTLPKDCMRIGHLKAERVNAPPAGMRPH